MCVLCDESYVKYVLLQKKKNCNEGGSASSKEDSVQGGGADSISSVGAMKWW